MSHVNHVQLSNIDSAHIRVARKENVPRIFVSRTFFGFWGLKKCLAPGTVQKVDFIDWSSSFEVERMWPFLARKELPLPSRTARSRANVDGVFLGFAKKSILASRHPKKTPLKRSPYKIIGKLEFLILEPYKGEGGSGEWLIWNLRTILGGVLLTPRKTSIPYNLTNLQTTFLLVLKES